MKVENWIYEILKKVKDIKIRNDGFTNILVLKDLQFADE